MNRVKAGWAGRLDIGLERRPTLGNCISKGRAADGAIVIGDDVHAVEKHRLDRILPGPERQRIIAQRPKIGVEDKRQGISPGLLRSSPRLSFSCRLPGKPAAFIVLQHVGFVKPSRAGHAAAWLMPIRNAESCRCAKIEQAVDKSGERVRLVQRLAASTGWSAGRCRSRNGDPRVKGPPPGRRRAGR